MRWKRMSHFLHFLVDSMVVGTSGRALVAGSSLTSYFLVLDLILSYANNVP